MIGKTLGIYFGRRFARTVIYVFVTVFCLVYIIDLVELLRRTGEISTASTGFIAFLSLIRIPAITEQIMPFAILIGAMVAFLDLTRKLELVIARAAGVSVWQFLAPALIVAAGLGIFSTTVYNPIAALLKQRSDHIEAQLFGHSPENNLDSSLWIRQRSGDGQAIIHANSSEESGRILHNVTVYVFEPNGAFSERVEASEAKLSPGFWTLTGARVLRVDTPPENVGDYILATTLSADEITQHFLSPDAVPFWELPALTKRMTEAGLNSIRYNLRFQTLLARPLLFVAMVLVAASFSLKFFRMGGITRMVSGGIATGFVLYVVTKLVGDLGGAGLLNAAVAAWSPALIGSFIGAIILLHQEDG